MYHCAQRNVTPNTAGCDRGLRRLPVRKGWSKLRGQWRILPQSSDVPSPITPSWKNLAAEAWASSIKPRTRGLAGMLR